jgi:hypothetical protein
MFSPRKLRWSVFQDHVHACRSTGGFQRSRRGVKTYKHDVHSLIALNDILREVYQEAHIDRTGRMQRHKMVEWSNASAGLRPSKYPRDATSSFPTITMVHH